MATFNHMKDIHINQTLEIVPCDNEVFLTFEIADHAEDFLTWLEERGWGQFKLWVEADDNVC